ncbi:hypothetical protein QQX98_010705 [Neonectria punicea]|uniref:Uncharacterized protein n=1 Tax=Neonectria punicea TaxID=979145 RepID=A0ABR1GNS6_9HYPO
MALHSERAESKEVFRTINKGKKTVRFDVANRGSELEDERGRPKADREVAKADDGETQDTTSTLMLNHIADHLQFVALITQRFSVEKLVAGDVQDFPSSQAMSSDMASGRRSTVEDELEHLEGHDFIGTKQDEIVEEKVPFHLEDTSTSARPYQMEPGHHVEEMEASTLIDCVIVKPATTEQDAATMSTQRLRVECEGLMDAAVDALLDNPALITPPAVSSACRQTKDMLDSFRNQQNIGNFKGFTREDLRNFFVAIFSSISAFSYGDDSMLARHCTEEVFAERPHPDPQLQGKEKFASRQKLFTILVMHEAPAEILRFIKGGLSDFDIPISTSTLKQHLPMWTKKGIENFTEHQHHLLTGEPASAKALNAGAKMVEGDMLSFLFMVNELRYERPEQDHYHNLIPPTNPAAYKPEIPSQVMRYHGGIITTTEDYHWLRGTVFPAEGNLWVSDLETGNVFMVHKYKSCALALAAAPTPSPKAPPRGLTDCF